MTDRHLSNRFEQGTREHKLVRQYEIYMSGLDINRVDILDIDTRHGMLLLCVREDSYFIWIYEDDPEGWVFESFYDYSSYEVARKAFDEWSDRPLEPNWEAQAEYDEMHGTINGEDAGIVMMREL